MAQIAREADVSTQTVYNSVGAKRDLLVALLTLIDEAGDVAPIHQRIAATSDPREIVSLVAHLRRRMMEGAGDIVAATHAAAVSDADVREVYAASQTSSRTGIQRVCMRLDGLGALRAGLSVDTATDAVYALLHHAVWTRLVDECGWSADDAERWYAERLAGVLLGAGG